MERAAGIESPRWAFRFCPRCAAPQRPKLVEFSRSDPLNRWRTRAPRLPSVGLAPFTRFRRPLETDPVVKSPRIDVADLGHGCRVLELRLTCSWSRPARTAHSLPQQRKDRLR